MPASSLKVRAGVHVGAWIVIALQRALERGRASSGILFAVCAVSSAHHEHVVFIHSVGPSSGSETPDHGKENGENDGPSDTADHATND